MSSVLTIDLDYWQHFSSHGLDAFTIEKECTNFLKYVSDRYPGEIKLFREHDEMLKDLDRVEFDTLFNIDQHDDLADDVIPVDKENVELHCGNWPWFLARRKEIEYSWWYPGEHKVNVAGYDTTGFYKFRKYSEVGHINRKKLAVKDLKFVGICYSMDWVDPSLVAQGLSWMIHNKRLTINPDDHFLLNDIQLDIDRRAFYSYGGE